MTSTTETSSVRLAAVLPIYNEEDILWEAAAKIAADLDRVIGAGQWRFVFIDNGSTDRTPEIVEKIRQQWPLTASLSLSYPNFGDALRKGLEYIQDPWAYFICPDEWDTPFLAWAWSNLDRYDLFIGTKMADPTINQQHWYRRLLSWGLNSLLAYLLYHSGSDTHGPKVLRMEKMRPIIDKCVMSRGQFDTEFVLRAAREGLRIAEVPVVYEETRPPRNWMITKIRRNIYDLFRLYRVMKNVPFSGYVRIHRWGREDALMAYDRTVGKEPDAAPGKQT